MESTPINEVRRIDDDLYVITETESVHCYVLVGRERALVFDIGYGYEDIRPLVHQITSLPLMLVVSHGDPDHALGCGWFDKVWVHPLDWGKVLANDTYDLRKRAIDYRLHKMPQLKGVIDEAAFLSRRIVGTRPHFLYAGDIIELGGVTLEVIHTPGHSYGHIMLLDAKHGRLFSGDQVTVHNVWYFNSSDEQAPFDQAVQSLRSLLARRQEYSSIYPAHDIFPVGHEVIEDQLYCFEHELAETYMDDVPFVSFIGSGYQHRYRTCELIYSDDRLAEWLGHSIERLGAGA